MHSFFILISNHFSSYLSRIFLSYYLSCFIKKKIVPLFILSTSPSFVSLHPYTPKIGYSNVFVLYKTKIQQNYFIVSLVCNFTRHQHWYTNHQDFSIPIASSQIQPKDTRGRIAPMRPSQLLEEKRWPPLEILNNHQSKFQKLPSIDSPKIGSQAIQPAEWSSFMNNTSIIDYLSNNSNEPLNNSNSLKLEFDPPFRIKVNY